MTTRPLHEITDAEKAKWTPEVREFAERLDAALDAEVARLTHRYTDTEGITMTYTSDLPKVFPYRILVEPETALEMARILTIENEDASRGSSFAITTDTTGQVPSRWLWLSNVSKDRIEHLFEYNIPRSTLSGE